MLTVTAPIKPVINPDICESNEAFGRRIIANYDQMNEFITREDLFHVVTQPPEVFLFGEGESSFLSETEVYNTQHKKVEIINNLMNRILVSADNNLTYQDEVYITNVLHKRGIRYERTFMKKAYELFEETKQNNNLIEAYWENRQELSQMISFYRMQQKEGDTTEVSETTEEILHLHEDVFKRWMTAAMYRMQNNFRTTSDATYITSDSYRMTEEQRLSQQILLQRLRESVRGESVPLVYRHDNYYEQPGDDAAALSEEAVAEQIASAVLLSLVDNLYENISSKTNIVGDKYYSTENAFYGAADNVFERMEGNTSYIISEHRDGDTTVQVTENMKNEISAINEIIEQYYSTGDEVSQQYFERDILGAADMVYPEAPETAADEGEREIHVDQRNTIEQQLFQTNIINEKRQKTYIQNLERLSKQAADVSRGPASEEERRARMQFAFEHPEEFKEQARDEEARREEAKDEMVHEFLDNLPPRTRDVYLTIENYIKNPEKFLGSKLVQKDAETLLVREQIEAEREERLIRENKRFSQTIENSTETEKRMNERLQTVEQNVGRITPETIRFIHKVNDTTIDEETIESLRKEINQVRNDTKRVENKVENREVVTHTEVNNKNETIIKEQNNDEITRMIQDNLNRQIGNITSKVYDRLERQLMSERRRRGM